MTKDGRSPAMLLMVIFILSTLGVPGAGTGGDGRASVDADSVASGSREAPSTPSGTAGGDSFSWACGGDDDSERPQDANATHKTTRRLHDAPRVGFPIGRRNHFIRQTPVFPDCTAGFLIIFQYLILQNLVRPCNKIDVFS